MSFTRRNFLKSGAITVLAAGLVFEPGILAFGQNKKGADSAHGFQIPYEAQQSSVFYYTRATFEPYVGGIFLTRGVGGGVVELTLIAVRDRNPKPPPKSKLRVATDSRSSSRR